MSEKADKRKVRFNSKDIGDKHRQDKLFVNVKDDERRKRQQRRKDAANERKILREARREDRKNRKQSQNKQKANKASQKRDSKQLRRVAFATRCRKITRGIASIFKYAFTGKRKAVSLSVLAIIVAILTNVLVYRCGILPAREELADQEYAKYVENDAPTIEGVSSYVGYLMANDATSDEALNYLDGIMKLYDKKSDAYFILAVYYANFLGRNKDFAQGISRLDTLHSQTDDIAFRQEYLYNAYYELYSINQDYQKGNEYAAKVNEMHRRIVKKQLESSEEYYKQWSGQ